MLDILIPKLHKEGQKFLTISLIASFILLLFSKFLGFLGIIISIWVFYFFRDPDRHPIYDNSFLSAPADGMICQIERDVDGPKELSMENDKFIKVSIFMNVFNCHVNRIPTNGKIEEIYYKPGKFLNASLDKASEDNERNYYKIKSNKNNEEIIIVQIAGLIARRIVCEAEQGQELKQGDRIGMIRFGSRVDLYFKNKKVLVKLGQNVVAGESLIASE